MRFLRFDALVEADKTIRLPEAIASQVKSGERIRLDLWLQDDDDRESDRNWERMAAEELLKVYGEEDSIYDQVYGRRYPAGGTSVHDRDQREGAPGAGDARHRR